MRQWASHTTTAARTTATQRPHRSLQRIPVMLYQLDRMNLSLLRINAHCETKSTQEKQLYFPKAVCAAAAAAAVVVVVADVGVGDKSSSRSNHNSNRRGSKRKRGQIRSRNAVIDGWLQEECGGRDDFADLEDFIVV